MLALLVRRRPGRLLAWLLAAAVAVLVLAPTVALFFPALGLATAAVPAAFTVLLGVALLPVLELLFPHPDGAGGTVRTRRRLAGTAVPAVAALAAVALTATGLSVDTFDARHPAPSHLVYALDADSGQARWLSMAEPGPWTGQYLDAERDLRESFPFLRTRLQGNVSTGPARTAELSAPEVETLADDVTGGRREVTVRMVPRRPVQSITLDVAARGEIESASVAGRKLPASALGTERLTVTFHDPPASGVTVSLAVAATGPVRLRVGDASQGLSDLPGYVPRPDDVSVAGTHISDLVLVATTQRLR